MAPLVPGFLTSPKGQLIPDLGPASHSLVMSKSNGCTTESNSLWRSPRYKTLACKVRSTRKGQLHRPPPLLFPFWKLQRKIHRMIQILVPLCPAFPHPPNPPQPGRRNGAFLLQGALSEVQTDPRRSTRCLGVQAGVGSRPSAA